jgi:polyphosphate kinase
MKRTRPKALAIHQTIYRTGSDKAHVLIVARSVAAKKYCGGGN